MTKNEQEQLKEANQIIKAFKVNVETYSSFIPDMMDLDEEDEKFLEWFETLGSDYCTRYKL